MYVQQPLSTPVLPLCPSHVCNNSTFVQHRNSAPLKLQPKMVKRCNFFAGRGRPNNIFVERPLLKMKGGEQLKSGRNNRTFIPLA